MTEEFQESEVIFPDTDDNRRFNFHDVVVSPATAATTTDVKSKRRDINGNKKKNKKKKKKMANSLPVNIPDHMTRIFGGGGFDEEDEDRWDEDDDDDGELIPPHVIVRRRIAGQMAFSVCTGNGRTLKGRDLSQVRNSILRMTGFLET